MAKSVKPRTGRFNGLVKDPPAAVDVVARWNMNESADPLVDLVNSISVSERSGGTFTYNQTIGSPYASFSPGILMDNANSEFQKLTATSVLDIDSSSENLLMEWGVLKSSFLSPDYHWTLHGNGATTDYGVFCFGGTETQLSISLKTEDATTASNTFTLATWSGTPTIFQAYFDFTGTGMLDLYQDGVSRGSLDISGLANKTFTNAGIRLGGQFNNGTESLAGTMFVMRISKGANALNNDIINGK